MKLFNTMFRWYIRQRIPRIQRFENYPIEVQNLLFRDLIDTAKNTKWGKQYDYENITTPADYRRRVPVSTYEDIFPYIERMMHGERDVLWPGIVGWFSKSSGTTSGKSKYIPVTEISLRTCHIGGAHDLMAKWYDNNEDARLFEGKGLMMGGSHEAFEPYPKTRVGDVSALMMQHMPGYVYRFSTPDVETMLEKNFDKKLSRMAAITPTERVTSLMGVPTWSIALFRRILDATGKDNLLEVWPNFQLYMHGGVNFEPYRQQFQEFFPDEKVRYLNVYNASEGFFAAQLENEAYEGEMTLLLDNGVFYEFLPESEWHKEQPEAIDLQDIELGENYAIVISTNAGLWRYVPGDTVSFTAKRPYKLKITGRTKHYINAFGEEVMVANTDAALAKTCEQTQAQISEYTVAPKLLSRASYGRHEWLIEFDREPESLEKFSTLLDKNLQNINSDYEAKRFKDIALHPLFIHKIPKGTFHSWLRSKGRYGGQNKVPRLANERKYLEEIMGFISNQSTF